jgi:hypothetical protein
MDFYHWWIYESILNAQWFVWTIVILVFLLNIFGPILIWFRINSKPLPFIHRKKKMNQNATNTGESNN